MRRTKEPQGSLLPAEEFVEKLNAGGWITWGGHEVRHDSQQEPVTKASLVKGTVRIEVSGRSFELPSNNIRIVDPWRIDIHSVYVRTQQRKKIEGGGWHEVPVVGLALRLQNPTLEEVTRKAWEEEARREKEEEKRQEAEACDARRQAFVSELAGSFVGKELSEVEVIEGSKLQLRFNDGSVVVVASEICYCYYGGGSAVVNNTSLRGFTEPEYVE